MEAKNILKNTNLKRTSARVKLLEIFQDAQKPLCYEEIKHNISMDKATFYRNITKFEKEGIINAFESSGKKRYFEVNDGAHAHFVCTSCHAVECIPEVNFSLSKYEVNNVIINGLCPSCLESK